MQKEETLLKKLTGYLAIIFAIDMLLFVITCTLTMIFSNSEELPKIWLSTFYYSSVLRNLLFSLLLIAVIVSIIFTIKSTKNTKYSILQHIFVVVGLGLSLLITIVCGSLINVLKIAYKVMTDGLFGLFGSLMDHNLEREIMQLSNGSGLETKFVVMFILLVILGILASIVLAIGGKYLLNIVKAYSSYNVANINKTENIQSEQVSDTEVRNNYVEPNLPPLNIKKYLKPFLIIFGVIVTIIALDFVGIKISNSFKKDAIIDSSSVKVDIQINGIESGQGTANVSLIGLANAKEFKDRMVRDEINSILNNKINYKVDISKSEKLYNGDEVEVTVTLPDLSKFKVNDDYKKEVKFTNKIEGLTEHITDFTKVDKTQIDEDEKNAEKIIKKEITKYHSLVKDMKDFKSSKPRVFTGKRKRGFSDDTVFEVVYMYEYSTVLGVENIFSNKTEDKEISGVAIFKYSDPQIQKGKFKWGDKHNKIEENTTIEKIMDFGEYNTYSEVK